MATGDQADFVERLKQVMPNGWFARGLVPLRDALLQGAAVGLAYAFALLVYVRQQTRIATASDGFLDLIALDFLGYSAIRSPGQSDASFRASIQAAMFRERGTRAALIATLTALTGRVPRVFEPMRPADAGGGYSGTSIGYGTAGYYGSVDVPYQAFVQVFRTPGAVADADIYAAIESVRPVAFTVWVAISS